MNVVSKSIANVEGATLITDGPTASDSRQRLLWQSAFQQKQKGQILPLGLVLLAFAIFMSMTLFNTGQVSAEKMRVTNAADSAAYSGLLWQARALNFQAYTNRAMVANQVSIAQAVSLRSWAQYGRISANNVNTVLGSLPFVGAVTNAFRVAIDTAATVIEPVAEALLFTADTVNQALSVSQEIMYVAGAAATPEVVRNVAKANNPNFEVASAFSLTGMAENANDWAGFTDSYGADSQAMLSRAEIINNSRDRFSRNRDWELFPFWFFSTPLTRHNVVREGETRLIYVEPNETQLDNGQTETTPGYWEWKAKDSVSLQTRIWRILGTRRIEVPIGWAQAHANDKPGSNGSIEPCDPVEGFAGLIDDGCPRWLGMNRSAERLASSGVPGLSGIQSQVDMSHLFGGLRDFRDLTGFPNQERDPRLELRVEVYTDTNTINTTSSGAFATSELFDAQLNTANQEIAAIAKSELYFHRPEMRHLGGYTEYANGYNPFWDVRLMALDTSERLAAIILRADGLLTPESGASVPTGVTDGSVIENGLTTELIATASQGEANGGLPDYEDFLSGLNSELVPDLGTGDFSVGVSGHFITAALSQPATVSAVESWISNDFELDASLLGDAAVLLPMFDTDALATELSDRFRDEVEDIVEEVAGQLLSNALSSFGSSSIGGNLQNAFTTLQSEANVVLDGLAVIENDLDSAISTLNLETQEHRNELERIRTNVAEQFATAVDEVEIAIGDELSELQADADFLTDLIDPEFAGLDVLEIELIPENLRLQIDELGIDITQELPEQAIQILQSEIDDLVAEQADVAGSELQRQAERLVEIIDNETDLFSVQVDTAMQVIELMEESEDPIDPLSVTDEEEL